MVYKFVFTSAAEKQIRSLDHSITRRILKKLRWIEHQDDPLRFATILHNSKIGDARFRVGDYRVVVILDIKNQRILIVAVGHRREIYR